MHIHRAFWIKLGKLAAMLDEIDEHRARLQRLMHTAEWASMTEQTQDTIREVSKGLDDIANLD